MVDFYKILDVDRGADADTIKKAYRKLAMKYHPDRNQGDESAEAKFKEISHAYEVLSDEKKRQNYDQFGSAEAPGGFDGYRSTGSPFDIFDMFNDVFGRRSGSGRQQHAKAGNLHVDLNISFKDAVFGCERNINISVSTPCRDCGTTGCATGSPKRCNHCGGLGRVGQRQGFMQINIECPMCNGRGAVPKTTCIPCGGSGYHPKIQSVQVRIPVGVSTGQKLRVAGKGEQAPGALPGDLIIRIVTGSSPTFTRENMDIHSTAKMSFRVASLGGSIDVTTVHGKQAIKIPPGTDVGTTMRLRNQGVPGARSRRPGHHYVHLDITVPKTLTNEQRNLIEKLDL